MRKISILYLAAVLAIGAMPTMAHTATATTREMCTLCQQQQRDNQEKLTPRQAADKLASELCLIGKQRKKLRKLNEKYASLIANPRFKGRPLPVSESDTAAIGTRTGRAHQAAADTTRNGSNPNHTQQLSHSNAHAHIRQQHVRRNAYNAELKTILTEEQYQRYIGQ